jgi:hypothetical protein
MRDDALRRVTRQWAFPFLVCLPACLSFQQFRVVARPLFIGARWRLRSSRACVLKPLFIINRPWLP